MCVTGIAKGLLILYWGNKTLLMIILTVLLSWKCGSQKMPLNWKLTWIKRKTSLSINRCWLSGTTYISSLVIDFGNKLSTYYHRSPEDDLDTRNITDIVVSSINEMKKQQQIIVVTHNPNIVVNTNSEQVIQLDYRNEQIINSCSGALD